MDLIEYVERNENTLHELARRSLIPILRLKRLAADPGQPLRYLTALRLVAASDGRITLEALRRRGEMRGEETYSGPLGKFISEMCSTGPDLRTRLAKAGLSADHLHDTLMKGRVPSQEKRLLYVDAFGSRMMKQTLFEQHARWRRSR